MRRRTPGDRRFWRGDLHGCWSEALMLITLAGVLMVMRRRRYNRAGKEVLRESLIRLSLFLELSALVI